MVFSAVALRPVCRHWLKIRSARPDVFLKSDVSTYMQKFGFSAQTKRIKENNGSNKGFRSLKLLAVTFAIGASAGVGYFYSRVNRNLTPQMHMNAENEFLLSEPPPKTVSKQIINRNDRSNLQLTIYQYEPCPFCKKVRAFLDFSGLSYDVVEVNSLTKAQLAWTSYKKVPIVVVKTKNGYQQLNDSTVIISTLASLLLDGDKDATEIAKCYPRVHFIDDNGKKQTETLNRYFVMYGEGTPVGKSKDEIEDERRWRKWSDDVLIHTLSPNIYRTWDEALEAFKLFSKNGDWERIFSPWEKTMVIYVGAVVMYFIAKRLHKRHRLMDDPRMSLYQELGRFLNAIKAKGTLFMGGKEPNLADLAVYGCLSSIEGTRSFTDVMNQNIFLVTWFSNMQALLASRRGQLVLPSEQ